MANVLNTMTAVEMWAAVDNTPKVEIVVTVEYAVAFNCLEEWVSVAKTRNPLALIRALLKNACTCEEHETIRALIKAPINVDIHDTELRFYN